MPVRQRNVAMVYQQFINYPSMTVADNIASPLRLRGEPDIDARVQELAAKLHIEPFLERLPAELSGGQQQRVALARALAKNAPLMLLDEPLVNLDYKLREELREELPQLFAAGRSTVVYATTEPTEALLLGGYTAVLDAGELLQYGPTAEVFHRPKSIRVARAFSDPPMNLVAAERRARTACALRGGVALALRAAGGAPAALTVGIRAGALRVRARDGDSRCRARSSSPRSPAPTPSCTSTTPIGELVAQLTGRARSSPWASRSRCISIRATALRLRRRGALLLAPPPARRADMARIDLDLAHAYKPNPQATRLRAAAAEDDLRRRRRLRAARPLGLRQDDAAQHRLRPGAAVAGHRDVRRRRRHRATPQQRNIAQVFQFPVIYDTMTVAENLAFPLRNRGVRARAHRASASARSPRCSS